MKRSLLEVKRAMEGCHRSNRPAVMGQPGTQVETAEIRQLWSQPPVRHPHWRRTKGKPPLFYSKGVFSFRKGPFGGHQNSVIHARFGATLTHHLLERWLKGKWAALLSLKLVRHSFVVSKGNHGKQPPILEGSHI